MFSDLLSPLMMTCKDWYNNLVIESLLYVPELLITSDKVIDKLKLPFIKQIIAHELKFIKISIFDINFDSDDDDNDKNKLNINKVIPLSKNIKTIYINDFIDYDKLNQFKYYLFKYVEYIQISLFQIDIKILYSIINIINDDQNESVCLDLKVFELLCGFNIGNLNISSLLNIKSLNQIILNDFKIVDGLNSNQIKQLQVLRIRNYRDIDLTSLYQILANGNDSDTNQQSHIRELELIGNCDSEYYPSLDIIQTGSNDNKLKCNLNKLSISMDDYGFKLFNNLNLSTLQSLELGILGNDTIETLCTSYSDCFFNLKSFKVIQLNYDFIFDLDSNLFDLINEMNQLEVLQIQGQFTICRNANFMNKLPQSIKRLSLIGGCVYGSLDEFYNFISTHCNNLLSLELCIDYIQLLQNHIFDLLLYILNTCNGLSYLYYFLLPPISNYSFDQLNNAINNHKLNNNNNLILYNFGNSDNIFQGKSMINSSRFITQLPVDTTKNNKNYSFI